ncbi:MAG: cupin domain-containing protein [Chloroflexota bacterium]|nr:MAG: cupin domain-containing protein [Chloroflexota bacterium]
MDKKVKFIRPFKDIEPYVGGVDWKGMNWINWQVATPKTVGIENAWLGMTMVPKGRSSRKHAHPYEEIYFVLEGEMIIEVGDNGEEKYHMQRYDMLYFPPRTMHQIRNFSKEDVLFAFIYAPLPAGVAEGKVDIYEGTISDTPSY